MKVCRLLVFVAFLMPFGAMELLAQKKFEVLVEASTNLPIINNVISDPCVETHIHVGDAKGKAGLGLSVKGRYNFSQKWFLQTGIGIRRHTQEFLFDRPRVCSNSPSIVDLINSGVDVEFIIVEVLPFDEDKILNPNMTYIDIPLLVGYSLLDGRMGVSLGLNNCSN